MKEIKTVPHVPLPHPFVERLIGTIRREYLDGTLFWTTADLEAKLFDFQNYYNGYRTHAGRDGRLPEPNGDGAASPLDLDSYGWQTHCRGLYTLQSQHDCEFAMDRIMDRHHLRLHTFSLQFTRGLGIAEGKVSMKLGGEAGRLFRLKAGDSWPSSRGGGDGLKVVGGYPPGPSHFDMKRQGRSIPKVSLPSTDPFCGEQGPLVRVWSMIAKQNGAKTQTDPLNRNRHLRSLCLA